MDQQYNVTQCVTAARSVSFGSENDQVFMKTTTENTVWRGAALLLSVAAIANKEFHSKDFSGLWDDKEEEASLPELPDLTIDSNCNKVNASSKPNSESLSMLAPRIDSLQNILIKHPITAAAASPPSPTSTDDRASDSDDSHKTNNEFTEPDLFTWSRARTVSIDSPDTLRSRCSVAPISPAPLLVNPTITLPNMLGSNSNLVSPLSSPVVQSSRSPHRLPLRKTRLRLSLKAKRDQQPQPQQPQSPTGDSNASLPNTTTTAAAAPVTAIVTPPTTTTTANDSDITNNTDCKPSTVKSVDLVDSGDKHRSLHPAQVARDKTMKKILRKKFSWKNYPELEAFLIANREEYLRHSALNYTVQQKQYNNKLTEQLLELAAQHGYIFDEKEFSFVTVRDRIRCYFKSYVQSAKKRGIIIGYAARKAGLLTQDDLERSAGTAGRIIIP